MDSIQQFWAWFRANHAAYFFLNQMEAETKEGLLNQLLDQLHRYCDKLYFEMGGHPDEDQELIITAEGNTGYFEKVESLVAGAPEISGWKFIAFIPPKGVAFRLQYEDVELRPGEMWFLPLHNPYNPASLGIRLCTANYELIKESRWLDPALYKLLDIVIGEKSFALDIDYVALEQLPDDPDEQGLIRLSDLQRYISWKKKSVFR
ncbi:MAG TPA: hypothetical protein VFR58_05790 [Flavisolibacter sp.]|nr:hypothetical protein [Flavisolibacter sp.]